MNVTVSSPPLPPPPRVFTITLTEPEARALERLMNTSGKYVGDVYTIDNEACLVPLWHLLDKAF